MTISKDSVETAKNCILFTLDRTTFDENGNSESTGPQITRNFEHLLKASVQDPQFGIHIGAILGEVKRRLRAVSPLDDEMRYANTQQVRNAAFILECFTNAMCGEKVASSLGVPRGRCIDMADIASSRCWARDLIELTESLVDVAYLKYENGTESLPYTMDLSASDAQILLSVTGSFIANCGDEAQRRHATVKSHMLADKLRQEQTGNIKKQREAIQS
jgi:hypothetical protein